MINDYQALAKILREHARLIRENTAMRALLQFCQDNKAYPVDYAQELESAKTNPKIIAVGQTLEILAAAIEQEVKEGSSKIVM